MTTEPECVMVDPWGIVFPCDTPEPCSNDGLSLLWTVAECGDAPALLEWCGVYQHPACPTAAVEVGEPPDPDLPVTGGSTIFTLLCAIAFVAGGQLCRRISR